MLEAAKVLKLILSPSDPLKFDSHLLPDFPGDPNFFQDLDNRY